MKPVILAVESSCDETSAAISYGGNILANVITSQEVHKNYGGVVPELASRAHQQQIVPVVEEAFKQSNINKNQLNAVAFTRGPGLLGALLVGTSFAKSLSWSLNIPLIQVHHMQAHILSHFIDPPAPAFPYLCLTVSGGHTQVVKVNDYLDMDILGETRDDAVGEAFDKTAKLLGFPYPGGPMVDKYAQEGNPEAFTFPEVDAPAYDFSFSGIKTAFLYFLQDNLKSDKNFIENNIRDICASIQHTLLDMLFKKLIKAAKDTGINEIAVAGGVAANKGLRYRLNQEAEQRGWNIYVPDFQYCTDNAGMIACLAHHKFLAGRFSDQRNGPLPRMAFE